MEKNKLNMKIVNEIDELIGKAIRTKKISERKAELKRIAELINTEERNKFRNGEMSEYEWTSEEEIDWACGLLKEVSEMF